MGSHAICLFLFASIVSIIAEPIVWIKIIKVITDRVVDFLRIITADPDAKLVGKHPTTKITYTLDRDFAKYKLIVDLQIGSMPGLLKRFNVKAEQTGDEKIVIKEIKQLGF